MSRMTRSAQRRKREEEPQTPQTVRDNVGMFLDRTGGKALRGGLRLTGSAFDLAPGNEGYRDAVDEVIDDRFEPSLDGTINPEAGRAGEVAGKTAAFVGDAATLAVPSFAASKGLRATRMYKRAMEGSKAQRGATMVGETVTSGLPASAVDMVQESSRGNEPSFARSVGVGAAVDAALPGGGAAVRGVTRLVKSGLNKRAAERIAKEINSMPTEASITDNVISATRGANGSPTQRAMGALGLKGASPSSPQQTQTLRQAFEFNAPQTAIDHPQAIGRAAKDGANQDSTFDLVIGALAKTSDESQVRSMLKGLSGGNFTDESIDGISGRIAKAETPGDVLRIIDDESNRLANIAEHTPARQAVEAVDGKPSASAAVVESTGASISAPVSGGTRQFSPDLQTRIDNGAINPDVREVPINSLEKGSDSAVINYDGLDRSRIDHYKSLMREGKEIDPIVLRMGEDGTPYISDGAHRIQAARELGYENIDAVQQKTAREMAASVEPHTEAQLEGIEMKVHEAFRNKVAETNPNYVPMKSTYFEEGANTTADELLETASALGINLYGLSPKVMRNLSKKEIKYGRKESFYNAIAYIAQDTISFAARTLGRSGSDLVYGAIQGEKFMGDHLRILSSYMHDTNKLVVRATGGDTGLRGAISGNKGSSVSRQKLFENISLALEDRANASQYLRTDTERELFERFETFFDYFKDLRISQGLPVEENYRPWVRMMVAAEPPKYTFSKSGINVDSPFSKERMSDVPMENIEGDLGQLMHRYAMSQLSEMAYKAPIDKFNREFANSSGWVNLRKQDRDVGLRYITDLLNNTIRPKRKNVIEVGIDKLVSNVYSNILRFNGRVALLNLPQRWLSNSQVSKDAVRQAKKMSPEMTEEIMSGLAFGNKTVNDMARTSDKAVLSTRQKKLRDALDRIDFEARSEIGNITDAYKKGFVQGVMDTPAYRSAKQQGMSTDEAIRAAMQDDAVMDLAIRRGNLVVSDTQFGISKINKPLMLRAGGSYARPFQMFLRFPLGMSNFVLQSLNGKNMRALEFLKSGDPRKGSLADMHMSYRALEDAVEESLSAARNGTDVNVPIEALEGQLKVIKTNRKIVDDEILKLSQQTSGRNLLTVTRMWGAAAAIQVVFDGGAASVFEDPEVSRQALTRSNPTLSDRVAGRDSPLSGITSAASPMNPYGGVRPSGVMNLIPGAGGVYNRYRDASNIIKSLDGM